MCTVKMSDLEASSSSDRVADAHVCSLGRVEAFAPTDDVQTECFRARGDLFADGTEPSDAERLAENAFGAAIFCAFPFSSAQRIERVGDASVDGDNQPEYELGDRRCIFSRAACDVDPFAARGPNVDGADLSAGANNQMEIARFLDRRRGHFGGAHHENANVGDFCLERLFRELGLVRDFDRKST
jgi:hypothetical protein